MDSLEQSSLRESVMPFLAIMQADLVSLFKTRITYGWLIIGIFLMFTRVLSVAPFAGIPAAVGEGLGDFIYIWSFLVIGIAASTVSSQSGELADSIMSKSVKRNDYIFAKFASRIIYVLAIYFTVTVVLVAGSLRVDVGEYDMIGLVASVLFVALAMTMLTTLGVTLSTFVSNSIVSIVSLLILWYSMTIFFPVFDLELLSPSYLVSLLPDIIQGVWNGEEWITASIFTFVTVYAVLLSAIYFSTKDL
ncbi:MAG: ABC transporter permease [Candidatus Thorarchaeota archaeon]